MKKVLIISPYFPPSNAADMQRVRMSLPYFSQFNWEAEVVMVDSKYTDQTKDDLLSLSIPAEIKIHRVKALSKQITQKFRLGSLALRSLWFYKKKVNSLLRPGNYDLIYFSTTQFPVCILGAYWKKRFGVPYIIDMQDPWHSDYYLGKPKAQQPPKYWFSYRLNKYFEPIAMKKVGGLISVSQAYIDTLKKRYANLKTVPFAVIPFGFFKPDMAIAKKHYAEFTNLLSSNTKNVVYVGRGGADMHRAIAPVFECLQRLLSSQIKKYQSLRFYFIGTSYAPQGLGTPSIMPLAQKYGLQNHVVEITDRISFYHTLNTLQQADALFVPGSDDPQYTASKLYPYLISEKPLLSILNDDSPALEILLNCGAQNAYGYKMPSLDRHLKNFLENLISNELQAPVYNQQRLAEFNAVNMTRRQCELFDQVV